ncbi:flagellar hook protein FlgE [Sphingomonas sp. LaA6.9]|uniref:flagellar hook protein FlgE n=1 Tax=Sphingomonas sp. LaA6.9 TaxID=2919914 RepID=UPI001F4F43D5|nr:flagellar hook protein FlgE [Sphingomonas sp. LaA6.9]MCJ8156334.1 flagellar hook protein FlgE [Sphingomonas sp. LaA6.9]
MSFYTSLSGLKGAQTELAVVSNNIANVGTVGFKKSRTEFGDLMSASPMSSGNVAGQGTRLKSITQQFGQGGFQASERALDIAISGEGFFMTRGELTGGRMSFTRNGAFGIDPERYVRDSRGAYLQVLPVDTEGNVTATGISATRNLQIPQTSGASISTSAIDISVTLPQNADLPASRPVYNAANPYAFDRTDPNSYNYSTAATVYDAAGNALAATVYYVRTGAPGGAVTDSTWEAHLFVGNQEVSSNPAQTSPAVPLQLTFDAAGTLTAPAGPTTFASAQPSGAAQPLNFTVDFGTATTQAGGPFVPTAFDQNGVAAGKLDNVSVGSDGLVTATFSNGDTIPLGKVVMAAFANPSGLRQFGDASWGITGKSGDATIGEAGKDGFGVIQSGALEQANVDITEELVQLIAAQRNFQANAKAIETANTMTQAIVNIRT